MNTEEAPDTSALDQNESTSTKSNESTISGKRGSENIGLAVFKDDKLVGELDAIECLSFLNINNKVKSFFISIPDSEKPNTYIDLYLSPIHANKISVDISNGSPYIKIKFSYSARVYSMDSDSKYLDDAVLNDISHSCNAYLKSTFSDYLYKTSLEFKADINDFGGYSAKNFLTTKEFEQYNWKRNYENSVFNVMVDVEIESGLLVTET